jgi:hypothetical protein
MTTFTYTDAEREHLRACCEAAWHYAANDLAGDVGYFRYLAVELEREHIAGDEFLEPGEDIPTAAQMHEQADAIECGCVGGESL